MKACVITIGNEILKGRTVNTNAAYIGKFLTSRGYEVEKGLIVKDDLDEIKWAIETANGKYDLIVTTGGLGPTFDDMTVEGVARALELKLVTDPDTLKALKERYNDLRIELTEERLKLALIPEGSRAIRNMVGAAPGVWLDLGRTGILILPGVPREMESIINSAVPLLGTSEKFYHERTEHLEGVMESSLAPLVSRIMEEQMGKVYIKSHPLKSETRGPEIDVEVSAYASTLEEATQRVEATINEILEAADQIRKKRAEQLSD